MLLRRSTDLLVEVHLFFCRGHKSGYDSSGVKRQTLYFLIRKAKWHFFCFCFLRNFNVSVPMKTRNNGTLYLHAFLYPRGKTVDYFIGHSVTEITAFAFPQASFINLLGTGDSKVIAGSSGGRNTDSVKQYHEYMSECLFLSICLRTLLI